MHVNMNEHSSVICSNDQKLLYLQQDRKLCQIFIPKVLELKELYFYTIRRIPTHFGPDQITAPKQFLSTIQELA